MNWLEDRLGTLQQHIRLYEQLRAHRASSGPQGLQEDDARLEDSLAEARQQMFDQIEDLVGVIARRPGVHGAFIVHDGLLMGAKGRLEDFESRAAVAQQLTVASEEAMARLGMGAPRQLALIGERDKLALVFVGPLALGIACPASISLSSVLA